jgi:hypothetical protein
MTAADGAGKSCDGTLTPFPGSQLGYKPLTNRCEGFYVSKVSSGSLEVVSLTRGRLDYEWRADVVLEVTAPAAADRPINIRAVAIPLKTYYRMDSQLSPGEDLTWPLRDILHPGKLTADRIGVFGWIGDQGDKEFIPVRVRQIAPLEDRTDQKADVATLVVRSSVDVDSFLWRVSERDGDRCLAYGGWQKILQAPRHAGAPVIIQLPEGDNSAQSLCVEVAAKERQSDDWLKLSLRIRMQTHP